MAGHEINAVRDARIAAGLSIKDLADLLQAPYRTVQEWNAGRSKPLSWVERLVLKEIAANSRK